MKTKIVSMSEIAANPNLSLSPKDYIPKSKTYYCHTDAGHGWLAVKRKELEELGILDQISSCSYQRGKTVYLEEDDDVSKFVKAIGGSEVFKTLNIKDSYKEYSPIRNYDHFSLT